MARSLNLSLNYLILFASRKGLEPPTCGLGNRRSIRLSYRDETPHSRRLSASTNRPRSAGRARLHAAPRFEVEADCLCPVTYVEFAKQIAQMKFDRIDRHAEFPRQLSIALTGFQCGKKIAFPVG
jgi:hypothetical protein